jgi:hypothetical protein
VLRVGARVRLRLDRGCRREHARQANGQIGTIVAVVTNEVLAPASADPSASSPRLNIESFAGHLYTVALNQAGGLRIELCAVDELEPLPAEAEGQL